MPIYFKNLTLPTRISQFLLLDELEREGAYLSDDFLYEIQREGLKEFESEFLFKLFKILIIGGTYN